MLGLKSNLASKLAKKNAWRYSKHFLHQVKHPIKRLPNLHDHQEISYLISGEIPHIEVIARKIDVINGKIPPI